MPVVMTAPGLLTAMILISFLSCRVLLEPRSEDAGQRFHVAGAGLDRWNDALPCKSVCGRRIHPEKMPARGWDATRRLHFCNTRRTRGMSRRLAGGLAVRLDQD